MVIKKRRPSYYDENHRYAVFIYPPDEDGTPTLNPQKMLDGKFWSPYGFYSYLGFTLADCRSIAKILVDESHRIGKFISGSPETRELFLKIMDDYADANGIP